MKNLMMKVNWNLQMMNDEIKRQNNERKFSRKNNVMAKRMRMKMKTKTGQKNLV